jgi:ribose-phosphate pyrophosphokinase
MILPGGGSQSLAAALAAELDEPLAPVEYDRFADGEGIVRAEFEPVERVVVVAATESDEAIVQLLQLQDLARRSAEEVVTVLPYMGYARQDEAFRPGEPVSARAVARAISTGTDRVLTVNAHEASVGEFFSVPVTDVDAAGRLAEPLPDLVDPLFLAPDASARPLARTVREAYGDGTVDHFEKRRDRTTGEVSVVPSETRATDRDAVLVDDIVATGGTMSEAITQLGTPARTFVTCVHPMLAAAARTRLASAGVEAVYGTDTLEREVSTVSVAPVLAAEL